MRRFWNDFLHPSWHFYAVVWGIIVGVVLGQILRQVFAFGLLWWLVIILLTIVTFYHPTRPKLISAFTIGLLLANSRLAPELSSANYFNNLVGTNLTISGKIIEDPDSDASGTTLKLAQIKYPADSTTRLSGTIYVKLANNKNNLEKSDVVTLKGKLSDGFGTFVATMFRPEVVSFERSETGDIFARTKHWFAERVRDFIPAPESELGLGYLMGLKSGLPETLLTSLQIVGMTHVIVASGAHLGILTSAAKKFFGRISKFASLLFSLLLIFAFVGIVGFTPSMTRAGLVSALSLSFGYVGRKFTPFRLLGFVAALTLLIEPVYFFNLGWQLSFASFFGILILAPRLQKVLYGGKKPPWLASMLMTSVSTTLVCAPILIYNFGSLSLLSLVVNLIILPTLPYAMLLIFLTGATSFLPLAATIFGHLATFLLDLHIFVVSFFAEKTMFVLSLPSSDFRIYFLYLPLLFFLTYPQAKRRMKKLLHLENSQKLLYNGNNES